MDNKLTDVQLVAIHDRLRHASPGPWKSYIEGRDHTSGSNFIMTGTAMARGPDIELSGATDADQDFIAGARQDIADLLAEIARLRTLLNADERATGTPAR
ncbi:MAG: hypothetical protein QFF03_15695 [Pseudomonadota bacterium]|nr:hypothetical protein [Pseudomonadota bacterium]